jgi:hypothetical protein
MGAAWLLLALPWLRPSFSDPNSSDIRSLKLPGCAVMVLPDMTPPGPGPAGGAGVT